MNIFDSKVSLEKEDVQKCYEFAVNVVGEDTSNATQSIKHFGGVERSKNYMIADITRGKLGEMIFKKHFEKKIQNSTVELDFDIKPLGEYDDGDAKIFINNWPLNLNIDIKTAPNYSEWLLVEDYKFYDNHGNPKSYNFALVQFDKGMLNSSQMRKNPELILNCNVSGEIKGWTTHKSFLSNDTWKNGLKKGWFMYWKGQKLFNKAYVPDDFRNFQDVQSLKNAMLQQFINDKNAFQEKIINYFNDRIYEKGIVKHPDEPILFKNVWLDANVNYGFPIKCLDRNLESLVSYNDLGRNLNGNLQNPFMYQQESHIEYDAINNYQNFDNLHYPLLTDPLDDSEESSIEMYERYSSNHNDNNW